VAIHLDFLTRNAWKSIMNIVEVLKDQLGGQVRKQLGNAIGASESDTDKLVDLGLPSILGGLGKLASSDAGADSIAKSINSINTTSQGNLGNILGNLIGGGTKTPSGSPSPFGGILGNLFGSNIIDGIAAAISRYTGLNITLVKTGLTYLTPMVLGALGSQMKGAPASASSINNFFSSQKDNIKSSLPSDFSLDAIPGLDALSSKASAFRPDVVPQREPAAGGLSKVLVPLLIIGAIALAAYYLTRPKVDNVTNPNIDNAPVTTANDVTGTASTNLAVDGLKTTLTNAFDKINSSLTSITDAASAQAAVPTLEDSIANIDKATPALKALPAEGKSVLEGLIRTQLDKLNPLIDKITAIPGIGDTVKQLLEQLKTKLTGLLP
jgi:hypothetical protein